MRNNRTAGHGYELEVVTLLRESGCFPHIATSRSQNRQRDGEKVDLVNCNEQINGRLEYNFQCKNSQDRINYHQLLEDMPQLDGIINVVLHKYTRKSGKSGRFVTQGRYAVLKQEDFLQLIKFRKGYELLREVVYQLSDEDRIAVCRLLKSLGLWEQE